MCTLLVFGLMFGMVGFYIWYMAVYIPNTVAKMTPEEREKFVREWNKAGEWDSR